MVMRGKNDEDDDDALPLSAASFSAIQFVPSSLAPSPVWPPSTWVPSNLSLLPVVQTLSSFIFSSTTASCCTLIYPNCRLTVPSTGTILIFNRLLMLFFGVCGPFCLEGLCSET